MVNVRPSCPTFVPGFFFFFFLAHPNHNNNNNKTAQLVPISTACYIKFGITAILSLVLFFSIATIFFQAPNQFLLNLQRGCDIVEDLWFFEGLEILSGGNCYSLIVG